LTILMVEEKERIKVPEEIRLPHGVSLHWDIEPEKRIIEPINILSEEGISNTLIFKVGRTGCQGL